jgi:Protein of unknown function (DUF3105)
MAKKKQKKRSGPGRAGAGASTTVASRTGGKSQLSSEAESSVKAMPATPGGPNRIERKEAARQARERLRRKAARRTMYRRAAIGLVIGAIIAGIVTLSTRPKGSSLNAEEKALVAQAAQAQTSAGCDSVQTTKDYPDGKDRTHIGDQTVPTNPPLSSYPSTPPASGPHNGTPLPANVYADPPDIYQSIHSLEHAAVIIWYSPDAASDPATADALAKLQTFFGKSSEQTKVIVAPYNYPDQGAAGQLPQGKQMVLVAWHRIQTCDKISLPVAYNFVVHYRFPAPKGDKYLGVAPETNVPIG